MRAQLKCAIVCVVVVVFASHARSETFSNKKTGEVLTGRIVTTTEQDGKQVVFVRLDNGQTRLLVLEEWTIEKSGAQRDASTDGKTVQDGERQNEVPGSLPRPEFSYFVILIRGAIGDDVTSGQVQAELKKAAALAPTAVVLDIDTPGGSTLHAEEIIKGIIEAKDLRLVAFVRQALSAGAAVALACKEIYVAETATIGGLVSFIAGQDGLPVDLPPDFKEKRQSIWRATCRLAAERGGHSTLIPEAMIDMDFALTMREVDGRRILERDGRGSVIKAKGKILTLTAREAMACGLAIGIVDDYEALGEQMKMRGWENIKHFWALQNVNAKDSYGMTPLHHSAIDGDRRFAQRLLEKDADVGARDNTGTTPLHYAALRGCEVVAAALIAKGADAKAKNKDGYTPLHYAASQGHKEVAVLLIEKGADVNAKNDIGPAPFHATPLHLAAQDGHRELAALLLNRGANVSAKDKNGETPLHYATYMGRENVARLLIEKGADVNAKGTNGWTPLGIARQLGQKGIEALLVASGGVASAPGTKIEPVERPARPDTFSSAVLEYHSESNTIRLAVPGTIVLRPGNRLALMRRGAVFCRVEVVRVADGQATAKIAWREASTVFNRSEPITVRVE